MLIIKDLSTEVLTRYEMTTLDGMTLHQIGSVKQKLDKYNIVILLDIDETIFYPVPKWLTEINKKLGTSIQVEEIEKAGSLDAYFKNSQHFSSYISLVDKLRNDPTFNTNLPLLPNALSGIKKLESTYNLALGAYLTARPYTIHATTYYELNKVGLPSLPIISRPKNIRHSDAASWKRAVIELIALSGSRKGSVVVIDDNLELSRYVRGLNRVSDVDIISILFPGPLTKYTIQTSELKSNPSDLFYIADWENIPNICASFAYHST